MHPSGVSGRGELIRLRHRSPAGEALADVDGRAPVDERLPLEERRLFGGPERDDAFGSNGASADDLLRSGLGGHSPRFDR